MMRTLRVALIALFLATAVASAKDRPAHPILGLVWSGGGKLAWLDPLTLEPVREAEFRFPSGYYGLARSPDGRTIALRPRGASRVRVISAASLRVVRTIPALGVRLAVSIWPTRDRLVGYAQGEVAVVDLEAGRVVSRSALEGELLASATTRHRLVLLLGRKNRIGPVMMATVEVSGSVRSVQLPALQAGFASVRGSARRAQLGLALDPSGRRAAVVAPGVVAEVDLASLTVSLHRLEARRPAAARKAFDGWSRTAVWAAPSVLAVTGTDSSASDDGHRLRQEPVGLTLLHTGRWEGRVVDSGASQVTKAGRTLLVTGARCEPADRFCRGIGLRGYTLSGSRRFHLFGNESLGIPEIAGGLAYLSDCNSFCHRIVDPATGHLIGRALPRRQTVLLP